MPLSSAHGSAQMTFARKLVTEAHEKHRNRAIQAPRRGEYCSTPRGDMWACLYTMHTVDHYGCMGTCSLLMLCIFDFVCEGRAVPVWPRGVARRRSAMPQHDRPLSIRPYAYRIVARARWQPLLRSNHRNTPWN